MNDYPFKYYIIVVLGAKMVLKWTNKAKLLVGWGIGKLDIMYINSIIRGIL